MAKTEQYVYSRLTDAVKAVGKRVNLYGVVSEYEQPKKTRGSDMICTMTVQDGTLYSPGLRVLVFSSTVECVPQVKAIGDLIRFHRAEIKVHNESPQAVVRIKQGGTFLIFDGNGSGYAPYQESSKQYTMEEHDHKMIDCLRAWMSTHQVDEGPSDFLVEISGIEEGNYFDLCCKILFIDNQESTHSVIFYVWDGTDSPPVSLPISETQVQDGELPYVDNPGSLPARDSMSTFPPVGTVLPIVLSVDDLLVQPPSPGNWIKFRNLKCQVISGIYEAVFLRESKISLLSSNCEGVKKKERNFERRMLDAERRLPQWAFRPLHSITVTDYEHAPFSTLREILTYPKPTYKFRCLVRVISIVPSRIQDFCVPVNSDMRSRYKECQGKTFIYRLRLLLEDPTARIHAFLCFEDAEHFFNGHPAADFHGHDATIGALERKVHKLLGLKDSNFCGLAKSEMRYNPPWIKCCIKSYYLQKDNPWDSRQFRIFGTILL